MIQIGAEITTDGSALRRDLRRDASAIESSLGGAFRAVAAAGAAPLNVIRDIGGAATGGCLPKADTAGHCPT